MKNSTKFSLVILLVLLSSLVSPWSSLAIAQNEDVAGIWNLSAQGTSTGCTEHTPCQTSPPYLCGTNICGSFQMGDPDIHVSQTGTVLSASEGDVNVNLFTLNGTINGNVVAFTIQGLGITPGIGPATTTYTGTLNGNTISGNLSGYASWPYQDASGNSITETATWTGTFMVTIPECEKNNLIVNVGSGRCLTGGNPVVIQDCHSLINQLFCVRDDGTIRVSMNNQENCLSTNSGMVVTRKCDGSPDQKWQFNEQQGWLVHDATSQCADISVGSQAIGANVVLFPCGIQLLNGQSQIFTRANSGTLVEQCFGGQGSMCSADLPLPPPFNIPSTPPFSSFRQVDGTQQFTMSVGSIAHDTCCLNHPQGAWCQPYQNDSWLAYCKAEWEKAKNDLKVFNNKDLKMFKWWSVNFGPYSIIHYSDDLQTSTEPQRHLSLPTAHQGKYIQSTITETVSTRQQYAPPGTRLDAGDQEFCRGVKFKKVNNDTIECQ